MEVEVAGVDFFAGNTIPVLRLDEQWAERMVRDEFGLTLTARSLGSQQDANFLLTDPEGAVFGVLKIANPIFTDDEVSAQDAAAALIGAARPDLRAAGVLHDADGQPLRTRVDIPHGSFDADNASAVARIIRFLPGGTPHDEGYLRPSVVRRLGEITGIVSATLHDFDHPGLDRVLQWDPQYADRTAELLAEHLPDDRREEVMAAASDAWTVISALVDQLPQQAVHLDLTDDNVVYGTDGTDGTDGQVDGLIDFGDLTRTWAVAELAISMASLLHHPGMTPALTLEAVRGFHSQRPLSDAEIESLWPMVLLRATTLVTSGSHQVAIDGDNDYAGERVEHEWLVFDVARSVPMPVMTALYRAGLGLSNPAVEVPPGRLLAVVPEVLDLGWDSPLLDEGRWIDSDPDSAADRLAVAALVGGAAAMAARYGEPRLAGSPILTAEAPATVATVLEIWTAAPEPLTAPWAGEIEAIGNGFTLTGNGLILTVTGAVGASGSVSAGDAIGSTVPGSRLRVGLRRVGASEPPALVVADYAPGWLATTADPASLVGLAPYDAPDDDLLARREAHVAEVQEHYFDAPPRIERGWRHHLATSRGRVLLDMVNNVASVGHAHPRVVDAAARQMRLLNTNSRFNYAAIVEFAERLTARTPEGLDTVFFVNSGSEAADLALRLALIATDRHDVIAMQESYHGWTYASDAISTSIADNPNALGSRPSWVHTVAAPNTYRGEHRDHPERYAIDAVAKIDALVERGIRPAAWLSESYYGNAGGMALPDGYLAAVYDAVRRHGGLAIADEIQVGYGRLGNWFWGFEQQGVVPDIIAVAKGVGNGHPVAAVITSAEVAELYQRNGYFFSSTGGSPVSSVIGSAVLDVIRDERLQENAAIVGGHLRDRLREIATRHPIVGAVHGDGLYLGVEFVLDRDTREPAPVDTALICDRLLDLGVVMQPTSDRKNVLKIKPPLCVDQAGVDFFADQLDRVLTEGW